MFGVPGLYGRSNSSIMESEMNMEQAVETGVTYEL